MESLQHTCTLCCYGMWSPWGKRGSKNQSTRGMRLPSEAPINGEDRTMAENHLSTSPACRLCFSLPYLLEPQWTISASILWGYSTSAGASGIVPPKKHCVWAHCLFWGVFLLCECNELSSCLCYIPTYLFALAC